MILDIIGFIGRMISSASDTDDEATMTNQEHEITYKGDGYYEHRTIHRDSNGEIIEDK